MRTFSYCKVMFCTKCGSQIGNEYHFCSTCGHKTRSELTAQFHYNFKTQFVRKISLGITLRLDIITKLLCSFVPTTTLISVKERSTVNLSYYGFQRREFSVTINELKNVIESEIPGPASMRGYRGLCHSLKTNYGIIVQRDIVMNVLKEVDPEGTNMRKARRLRRRKYVSKGPNSCWHSDGYDKLKSYGFPIHGCIDRYSRRILWLKVTKSNSHANVPAAY